MRLAPIKAKRILRAGSLKRKNSEPKQVAYSTMYLSACHQGLSLGVASRSHEKANRQAMQAISRSQNSFLRPKKKVNSANESTSSKMNP